MMAAVTEAGLDPLDQKAVRAWLREAHGVPQNSQWAIADAAARGAGWSRPDPDGYTDALYAGRKAHLRPVHDAIITLAEGLGEDARREGRATYIPVVRRTQFVAVAPGPGDTVRVGFTFRGGAPDLRSLEPLLQAAYDQNG